MAKKESLDTLYFRALKGATKEAREKTGGKKLDVFERGTAKFRAERRFLESVGQKREPWKKGAYDKEILAGMAKGPYVSEWANKEEEKGRTYGGQNLYDVAPATPAFAKKWAKQVAAQILRMNRVSDLTALFIKAKEFGYSRDADHFGYHLGMQSVGHGVGWTDDVPWTGRSLDDEIKLPYTEFYY